MTTADYIKAKFTCITVLESRGHRVTKTKKSGSDVWYCCPFHKEETASFHVDTTKDTFHCFGCGAGGDVIALLQKLEAASFADIAKKYGPQQMEQTAGATNKPTLPHDLHSGTRDEIQALARLRSVQPDALDLATERGLLRFGTSCRLPSWILTDRTGCSAQSRRMDGLKYPAYGDIAERKAHTIKGSSQSWPIGLLEAKAFQSIALVEGGPDLLAAFHFAWCEDVTDLVAPVAMLGAANHIPDEALPLFAGKRVRIFPHVDEAGAKSAQYWEAQLRNVGATVDCFLLAGLRKHDGKSVSDLNDLCHVHADDFEQDRALWQIMDYAEVLK